MIFGIHGTSLIAAQRILSTGWDAGVAAAVATPRIRTAPRYVYAYWGHDLDALLSERLWAAQRWAEEAVERHLLSRPFRAAVLLLRADENRLRHDLGPEVLIDAADIEPLRIVAIGQEKAHEHAWNEPPAGFCERCFAEPNLEWQLFP